MKYIFITVLCLFSVISQAQTNIDNTITYQGELKFNDKPANGFFDIKFSFYDDQNGGSNLFTFIKLSKYVTNGLFSEKINIPIDIFTGSKIWVAISVREGSSTGAYETLSPRQEITSAPYAIHAQYVDLNNIPASWNLDGNAIAAGDFIGTSNNQPFVVKVNNQKALEIDTSETNGSFAPNILMGGNNLLSSGVGNAISGGYDNNMVAGSLVENYSVIAGGTRNSLNGFTSTISGGSDNTVSSYGATIAGGSYNTASGNYAVVAGGSNNTSSGVYSSVSGGSFNKASGDYTIVAGGRANEARGQYSFAAGYHALSLNDGAFVWSDASSATDFVSTRDNQFRIRAHGGAYFEVSGSGLYPAGFQIEQKSSNGVGLYITQTSSDANLVLTNNGTGDFIKNFSSSGNLRFRVTNAGNVTADGTISGGGADFAEYFPTAEKDLQKTEVVALKSGKISRNTNNAERLFVISTKPAFVGNKTHNDSSLQALVALTGQVPVKVKGKVRAGDWLMATGDNDGQAKAIKSSDLNYIDYRQIIGQALENEKGGKVLALVGMPANDLIAHQQKIINKQQAQIAKINQQQEVILAQLKQTESLRQELAEIKLLLANTRDSSILAQNTSKIGQK